MGRKDITKYLSDLLEKHLNPSNDTRIYISKEVSFNCYGGEPVSYTHLTLPTICSV